MLEWHTKEPSNHEKVQQDEETDEESKGSTIQIYNPGRFRDTEIGRLLIDNYTDDAVPDGM